MNVSFHLSTSLVLHSTLLYLQEVITQAYMRDKLEMGGNYAEKRQERRQHKIFEYSIPPLIEYRPWTGFVFNKS